MRHRLLPPVFASAFLALPLLGACVAAPARQQAPTYVAIGASDAVGVGTADPARDGWVPRFGAALGSPTRIINLGVSGSTLAQALQEQIGPALDAKPDIVTVWLAVNDFNARVPLNQYEADLDRLLGALRDGGAAVLVGNVPDLTGVAAYRDLDPDALRLEVQAWNAAIARVAAQNGATVVDLYAGWQELRDHPEYVAADGFHPSADGYARLAALFADAYTARPG